MKYDFYKVYYENEAKYLKVNNECFKKIIDLFCLNTGLDLSPIMGKSNMDYISLVFYLDDYLCKSHPEYVSVLYGIMSKMGFNSLHHIYGYIKELSFEETSELNQDVRNSISGCSCVDDIKLEDGNISVYSDLLGTFSAIRLRKYFEGNSSVLEYLNNTYLSNRCHHVSFELMAYIPGATLVTYLLPSYFLGTYYHSVVRDANGMVIDPVVGIVLDEDTRTRLFGGTIVTETKGSELLDRFLEADEVADDKWKEICSSPALTIAIHEQIKKMEMKKSTKI